MRAWDRTTLSSTMRHYWSTKSTIKSWSQPLPMDFDLESSYSLFTRTIWRPWLTCYTEPWSTWMPRMRDRQRGRAKEKHDDSHLDRERKATQMIDKREEWRSRPLPVQIANFTLLDQVLMQIRDNPALTWLDKLKGEPNKRPRNNYCHFHRDHEHNTSNCYDLKQQIEALTKQGKLQWFIGWERHEKTH